MFSPYPGSHASSLARSDLVIPWSFFSLMCWTISKDNKDSFPNKSCMRKYPFVLCPFAPPSVKGRTEAPIWHWHFLTFQPFLASLLPLNSGPRFTGVCLYFFLLCNLRFSDAVARQVLVKSHIHWGGGPTSGSSHQAEPLGFQVHQDAKGWQMQSQMCKKCAVLPLYLLEPLLWEIDTGLQRQSVNCLPLLCEYGLLGAFIPVVVGRTMEQRWETKSIP